MATNVRAVLHLTMLAVPHLEKTEGNVVNVSSVNGIRSFPGYVRQIWVHCQWKFLFQDYKGTLTKYNQRVLAYNISKAALDQMTRWHCVTRAPLLYFIRSWVALSFKVVSEWVSEWGIGNTCPNLHFLQYIKAWMSSTDPVSSIINCYRLIVSYTDPVHSFIIS